MLTIDKMSKLTAQKASGLANCRKFRGFTREALPCAYPFLTLSVLARNMLGLSDPLHLFLCLKTAIRSL